MGTYRTAALAAHAARAQAKADAQAAARQALVDEAKTSAAPLWANPADGKPLIDPVKMVRAEHVDQASRLVILAVLDDKLVPEVHFAVYPDRGEKRVVTLVDGQWTGLESPPVADLDDVGAVLAGDI